MGKIVKYCAACDESFSEKFSFCPNCAEALTAFEMNPVAPSEPKSEPVKAAEPSIPPVEQKTAETFVPVPVETPLEEESFVAAPTEPAFEPELPAFLANASEDVVQATEEVAAKTENVFESTMITEPAVTIPASASLREEYAARDVARFEEEATKASEPVAAQRPAPVYQQKAVNADEKRTANKQLESDGFYSVTLVEEKNVGTRRAILLGSALFILTASFVAFVGSIYNANAFVGALDDDLNSIVYVGEDIPAEEPEAPEPKNKDKGGGGGGGGQKDPTPTSKGVLASQSEKPLIPPSAKMDKVTNPELVLRPETQGNRKEKPSNDPYGDPNSKFNIASDGPGSGGGQGSGTGRGQGSGRGTGAGSGDGSGNGSGIGNGNGNGRGNGDNGADDTPPPTVKIPPAGPTVALSITSKPRANYTDAARTNQVQGTVTLRVTFNANGTIGSISPVSGLPNGLTEQAIAAARGIRFEPAKKNGVPQTVTKQVAYTFTLY